MTPETMRKLAGGALGVSAFSIAVALLAYWRASGHQDTEAAHAEFRAAIDSLRERQTEMAEHTWAALDEAYTINHDRLMRLREQLRSEKEQAEAELRIQLERAEADVNELVKAVDVAGRTARDSTLAAAEQTERALAKRVREVEGRVALLRAKYKLRRAQVLADGREYDEALRALVAATDLVDEAQERLSREHDPALSTLRVALHEAIASLQSRAADSHQWLDDVLRRTDSLVRTLEEKEDAAAGRTGTGRPAA